MSFSLASALSFYNISVQSSLPYSTTWIDVKQVFLLATLTAAPAYSSSKCPHPVKPLLAVIINGIVQDLIAVQMAVVQAIVTCFCHLENKHR